jgi:hypothetical protein
VKSGLDCGNFSATTHRIMSKLIWVKIKERKLSKLFINPIGERNCLESISVFTKKER